MTANQDFVGYPRGQVLGIIDDRADAERAADELRQAGFAADDVRLLTGSADADSVDSDGSKHGVASTLTRGLEHLFSDTDHLAQYEGAIRDGHGVIAVHAEEEDRREAALEVFRRHRAHFVNYYGAMTVETLERG